MKSMAKVQLLSGERTQQGALLAAERAQLRFSGQLLEAVIAFKYLGITFSSATCLAGTAAPGRAKAAGAALHNCRARCAVLGIEAASAQLQLFSSLVDSVLSYGAEVWGPQLAAQAASGNGNIGCAAERLHLSFLGHMLGVRQGTPNAVVLAETGQQPLWARWLLRAARLWNKALAAPRQSVAAGSAAQHSIGSGAWQQEPGTATLGATAGGGVGGNWVQLDLADPQLVSRAAVRAVCQERRLERLMAAAERSSATKVQHYVLGTRGGTIDAASLSVPAAYLPSVRERRRWRALAQWRTGSFGGMGETGRWHQLPREQRICSHYKGGIETVHHMILDCPLYDAIHLRFPDLFNCLF